MDMKMMVKLTSEFYFFHICVLKWVNNDGKIDLRSSSSSSPFFEHVFCLHCFLEPFKALMSSIVIVLSILRSLNSLLATAYSPLEIIYPLPRPGKKLLFFTYSETAHSLMKGKETYHIPSTSRNTSQFEIDKNFPKEAS
jgi:hypothetical protein